MDSRMDSRLRRAAGAAALAAARAGADAGGVRAAAYEALRPLPGEESPKFEAAAQAVTWAVAVFDRLGPAALMCWLTCEEV